MQIFFKSDSFPRKFWNSIATIGIFDGVHIAHQVILKRVLKRSHRLKTKSLVVTFDPHPAKILTPSRVPPLLMSLEHRLRLLGQMGFDVCWVIHFTRPVAHLSAEDFVRDFLADKLHIRELYVGEGFRFGRKNEGDVSLLKILGKEHQFFVHPVKTIQIGREKISSTRIRHFIEKGRFSQASSLLGRPVSIFGTVVKGKGLGRRLGFPTANLNPHQEATPPRGVYCGWTNLEDRRYGCVVNIGLRPTIERRHQSSMIVEVHLLDFRGNLYHRDLEILFVKKLREEKKFPSLEALSHQVQRDIKQAKEL